jgi:phytoene desaturase
MTARVKGPTDHVVVVGAGLAGLSAALRLAGAGRKVTVVERESVPGGRNGLLKKDGYSFDTGPSVLTMPSLIQDAEVKLELKTTVLLPVVAAKSVQVLPVPG